MPGSYVKDTYEDFNKLEGTWKFQDANREFIIKLRKKTHVLDDFRNIYLDLIGGEYQYFLNGIEVVNTTANFLMILPFTQIISMDTRLLDPVNFQSALIACRQNEE